MGIHSAPPGGDELWPKFAYPPGHGAAATAWPAANTGYFVRFRVAVPRLVTGIRCGIGASSGAAKVGMYSSDGTTLTQLILSGATNTAGSNATQDIPFTAQITIVPFQDYCAFMVCDNGTVTVDRATLAAGGFATGFQVCWGLATAYTTPPTTQLISGLAGPSSGFTPILQLY